MRLIDHAPVRTTRTALNPPAPRRVCSQELGYVLFRDMTVNTIHYSLPRLSCARGKYIHESQGYSGLLSDDSEFLWLCAARVNAGVCCTHDERRETVYNEVLSAVRPAWFYPTGTARPFQYRREGGYPRQPRC